MDITNNIENTTVSVDVLGTFSATVTVTADDGYKITEAIIAYTNGNGYARSEDMDISEDGKTATFSSTDIDTTARTTTVRGTTEADGGGGGTETITITQSLSNCQPVGEIPAEMEAGGTLDVTIQANDNCLFDTEQSTPHFAYISETGYPRTQNLTVSSDNKTATGQITLESGWTGFSIVAEAYPQSVIGANYGSINVYKVTLDNLDEFAKQRFFKEETTDSEGNTTYEDIDLGSYVNRIKRIYTDIATSSTDVLRCGNYNTGIAVEQPATDTVTIDFGEVEIPAHNGDNTDYESTVQLFLPFSGFVDISNEYAGKAVSLEYVINVVTGGGVAKLSYEGVVFHLEEITPSSNIIYRTAREDSLQTVGSDEWDEVLFYGLEPYIYCRWYNSLTPGRNNEQKRAKIGSCSGFNRFANVDVISTPEMLTEEQETIYTALANGVYVES